MDEFANQYEEPELLEIFAKLFPAGFAGADVLRAIAPEGWAASPLVALFHPSAEQRYREALQMHRNMSAFRRPEDTSPVSAEPTFAEIAAEGGDETIEQDEEVSRLVGLALWDIFSDSHDVIDADGRELHLGSFRSSGGFLADRLNEQVKAGLVQGPVIDASQRAAIVQEQMRQFMPEGSNDLFFQMMKEEQKGPYDYMDFYLGTASIAERADLTPVYRMIFTRLKALDLDWKYQFPRLHAIDFRPLGDALDAKKAEESGTPDWVAYSPEEALAKDEANREKDRELAELRESLDEGYRESVEAALKQPPPLIVRVYAAVYGDWPRGWPPSAEA